MSRIISRYLNSAVKNAQKGIKGYPERVFRDFRTDERCRKRAAQAVWAFLVVFSLFFIFPHHPLNSPPSPQLLFNVALARPLSSTRTPPRLKRLLYSICSLRSLPLRSFLSSPPSRALALTSLSQHLRSHRYDVGRADDPVLEAYHAAFCVVRRCQDYMAAVRRPVQCGYRRCRRSLQ